MWWNPFKRKRSSAKLQLDRDYSFCDFALSDDDDDCDNTPIRILRGEWEGYVFRFNSVKFVEADGILQVNFTYKIIAGKQEMMYNENFKKHISLILDSILKEQQL